MTIDPLNEYFKRFILIKKQDYKWLCKPKKALNLKTEKIINFGCGSGSETLALLYLLKGNEGVGIDKDDDSIRNANSTLSNIRNRILSQGIPDKFPKFVKGISSQENGTVRFFVHDITQSLPLEHNSRYDIAFCNYVLYHIWVNGRDIAIEAAIKEMAKVVKIGGVIAVREPVQAGLDYESLFENNLGNFKLEYSEIPPGTRKIAHHIFRKTK